MPGDKPSGSRVRRVFMTFLVGALAGLAVWGLIGPKVIGWWYEPPSKDAFSCATSVREALNKFVAWALATAGGGGLGLAILVALVRRQLVRPAGPSVAPVAGAPNPQSFDQPPRSP